MASSKSALMRIRRKVDFEAILRKERPQRGKHLSIWIQARGDNGLPRMGLIVGRIVSPLAVIRNRWKRQIREVTRKLAEKLGRGNDLVLKPHAGQKNISSEQLREDLEKLIASYRQRK